MKAGVARRRITPPVGTDLSGYIGRPQPATSIHDDLYATALVLDDGKSRLGLLTLDLLSVSMAQDAELRKCLARSTGIELTNWLIASSHTHAGPAPHFLRRCGEPDDGYLRWAHSQFLAAAKEAASGLAEAETGTVRATSDLGTNRRSWVVQQGRQASATSGLVVDPEVIALVIDCGSTGSTVLYNYACHGVTLCGDNNVVSADWIGAARSVLESDSRASSVVFLQGCCGDIDPRFRGSLVDLQPAGETVARPLLQALGGANRLNDPRIRIAWNEVELSYLPFPSQEELEQEISFRRTEVEGKRAGGAARMMLETDLAMLSWAEEALSALADGSHPDTVTLPLQVISLGDVIMVCIPGEVFCEIGLEIKKMADSPVMVVGYANGNIGYVPTAAAYAEGGYEVDQAHKYYGLRMIAPDSAEIILSGARELMKEVGS